MQHPEQSTGFSNLASADRLVAETASKPRIAIYLATLLAVLLAWLWLAFVAAGASDIQGASVLGPGMQGLQSLLDSLGTGFQDNVLIQWMLKICTPLKPQTFSISVFATTWAMWMMMSVAMMLPSAAPMLRTYADIADVAAQKGEKVISVLVLAFGYLVTWGLFSALAGAAQLLLMSFGVAENPVSPLQGAVGGLILVVAGAYQFSALKNACLEKCRNPFSIIFGRWSTGRFDIFKLGLEQGAFCVGCCWALMLVMLIVGTMNLAWMAFFTLFTIIEKSGRGKVTSKLSGGILLGWGVLLLVVSGWSGWVS